MVFTKRMMHARMSSTCCWMGDKSGATVGRKPTLANYISKRTVAKDTVYPLVLTCPMYELTLTQNSLIFKPRSSEELETYNVVTEDVIITKNSITVTICSEDDCEGRVTINFDSNNVITTIDVSGETTDDEELAELLTLLCNIGSIE